MPKRFSNAIDPTRSTALLDSVMSPELWHKSAPAPVRRAARSGDPAKLWTAWSKYLSEREEPIAPHLLFPGKTSALRWNLPEEAQHPNTLDLVERLERLAAGRAATNGQSAGALKATEVDAWLARSAGGCEDPRTAVEAIAWARVLPVLAGRVSAESWWALLNHLVAAAVQAGQIVPEDNPLVHQLLAGELALSLAYNLPELKPCRELIHDARLALSAGLIDLLDGRGEPHGGHIELFRPLLACWTRCQALGCRWKQGCCCNEAERQYGWAVRAALRWTRPDGTQILGQGTAAAWCEPLFRAALGFDPDKKDHTLAAVVLPGGRRASKKRQLPDPADHSEWAATAILRGSWRGRGPWLAVAYPDQTVQMELLAGRDTLWSGAWSVEVSRNGRPLAPHCDWEQVCWQSDADGDYLELEMELTDGVVLQRQMMLARDDEFLLLTDFILGQQPGRLDYRALLPLRPSVAVDPPRQTRELVLTTGGKPAARVMPLALGQWRADGQPGTLARVAGGLELTQVAQGAAMAAPVFFDLRPSRLARPFTWRKLTVAESLEIQPDDVAVGYRVQIGKKQWVIYRSLAARANRTLLGHNLSSESLIARFDRRGEVEPLVEVE